jgi:hypothetical protein
LCSLLVSETCTHTEALEIKHEHIFYIALPWNKLKHYMLSHLMRECVQLFHQCVHSKNISLHDDKTSNIDLQTPQIKVTFSVFVGHSS